MRILIYSYVFLPSLGGIEIVSATLADNLINLGHQVTVVTETLENIAEEKLYKIVRNPSRKHRIELVKNHDIVHSNGASLALFFYSKIFRKPFLWTHGGYQLSCIDGLGWVDGIASPLTPISSILFYFKRKGLKYAILEGIKLYIRRFAGRLVDANVAITKWVAMRQPLNKQVVIYNPFPLQSFAQINRGKEKKYDFVYVGRLVSEKGVPDLIKAFAIVNEQTPNATLAIVGDGNWRNIIVNLTQQLNVQEKITFFGKKSGQELHEIISLATIGVVPSVWEEPMGGVALELMAAGKNLIVSKRGGLAECAGSGALVFDNGNIEQLADCMLKLLNDKSFQKEQLELLADQVKKFDPLKLTKQYESLYQSLLK